MLGLVKKSWRLLRLSVCFAVAILLTIQSGHATSGGGVSVVFDEWDTDPNGSTTRLIIPPGHLTCAGSASVVFDANVQLQSGPPVVCAAPGTVAPAVRDGTIVVKPHQVPAHQHKISMAAPGTSGDTCVKRNGGPTLGGPPVTVPLEMVELSLTTSNPITVTHQNATTSQWNVAISLSGTQSAGSITFVPTPGTRRGTVNVNTLPVGYQVVLAPITGGCSSSGPLLGSVTFVDTSGEYVLMGKAPGLGATGATSLVALILALATVIFWVRRTRQRMA